MTNSPVQHSAVQLPYFSAMWPRIKKKAKTDITLLRCQASRVHFWEKPSLTRHYRGNCTAFGTRKLRVGPT